MDERLRNAPCSFLSLDHEGYILEVNDTFLIDMDYEQTEVMGQHIEYISPLAVKMMFHSYFYPNITLYGHVKELFIKLRKKNGDDIPFMLSARRFPHEANYRIDMVLLPMHKRMEYETELRKTKSLVEQTLVDLEKINREIQQKQETLEMINDELVKVSNTDHLTGLTNRKYLHECLKDVILRFWENGDVFSLLIIDIDHFKQVNDCFGHPMGDRVLVKVADTLRACAPEEAIVTRYGGEEFVVLLPASLEEEAIALAERMKLAVAETEWEVIKSLTISIGVATFTNRDDHSTIIEKADQALYFSKKNGRNRTTHFNHIF